MFGQGLLLPIQHSNNSHSTEPAQHMPMYMYSCYFCLLLQAEAAQLLGLLVATPVCIQHTDQG